MQIDNQEQQKNLSDKAAKATIFHLSLCFAISDNDRLNGNFLVHAVSAEQHWSNV